MACAALAFGAPTSGAAQDDVACPDTSFRGPIEVTPASGAGGVSLNAHVKVLYGDGYFGPGFDPTGTFELKRCGDLPFLECEISGEEVAGRLEIVGDRWLFFVPTEELAPNDAYVGLARGVERDLDFQFRTGSLRDVAAPMFTGLTGGPSTARVDPTCDGGSGYRVDVRFPPARDDGPAGSIEYLLYLTRGPSLRAPELRARLRNFTTEEVTMAFVLDDEEATGPVCIVVHAVDGVGRVDRSMGPACFLPGEGTFFEPLCTVSAPGAPARGAGLAAVVALAAVAVRRRRSTR